MRFSYTSPTAAEVAAAERFLRGLPSETDRWFAQFAPPPAAPPEAHASLIEARRRGALQPVVLCGTALRFDTWFRVGKCADPLWNEAEGLYRPSALTASLCRIRDGRDRVELLLNHESEALLDTAGGALDLRLSAGFGRVLVRLNAAVQGES
jgi:hypothetical protein